MTSFSRDAKCTEISHMSYYFFCAFTVLTSIIACEHCCDTVCSQLRQYSESNPKKQVCSFLAHKNIPTYPIHFLPFCCKNVMRLLTFHYYDSIFPIYWQFNHSSSSEKIRKYSDCQGLLLRGALQRTVFVEIKMDAARVSACLAIFKSMCNRSLNNEVILLSIYCLPLWF